MKKLFFTLCALCLCGTMWGDTIGEDIQKDATTGLYFATVTFDNATTTTVIAIIPAQNGESYSLSNLVLNTDGTYTLPATVQAEGGEEVALQGVYASAFASVLTDTSNPIHLVIPANIINLGQEAFNKCTQIEEVTVEYSATNLDEAHNTNYNSFNNCSNIKTVTLDRDISIHRNNDQYAYTCFTFSKLPSIETVYIGEHVTTLANNAFNANGTSQLSAVYCYATEKVPSLGYKCFNYLATSCKLYVNADLVDDFKADSKEHTYGTDTFGYGWADIFGADNILAIGETAPEEETKKDVTTELYFDVDAEGVVSIIANESGTYTNSNLVTTDDDAYTLPEKVSSDGVTYYDVTRVDASAFANSSISGHLVIPATITAVGEKAFQNCTGLTEVTYEYCETALKDESAGNNTGTECFLGCSGVTTVNLNRDITLGNSTGLCAPFCYHTSVTTVYIGEYVTKIPNYMFRNTSNQPLATVYCYASTPPTLGTAPFDNLASTHNLYVNYDDVNTYKGDSSWSSLFGTDNIHSITGEDPEPEVDENAFQYEGLWYDPIFDEDGEETGEAQIIKSQDETVYSGTISIPEIAYNGENSYKVTRIDTDAFNGSSISGEVVIPANIINMGQRAFANCTEIETVTYEYSSTALHEENRTSMSDGSFMSCSGVKTVNLYRDINYDSDVSGNQCGPFRGVTSITTVNVGPRVTYIPSYIFRPASGTNNISTINVYNANPPELGSVPFSTLPSEYTINVPQGSVNTYTTSWADYSNFAEMSNAYAVNIHNVDADGDGYATFYDSNAVKLYGDVVAYTVSDVEVDEETNNAYVLMQELGDVIPGGTGALISGDVDYYTAIEETAVSGETYSGTDYLLGFDEDGQTAVAPGGESYNDNYYFYMLTLDANNDDNSLAFYWGAAEGAPFTCSAHKAYLALPSTAVTNATHISIRKGNGGEDTTGISSVENAVEGATVKGIYTIQGVRVSNMNQPGLYIVDGKKILVK